MLKHATATVYVVTLINDQPKVLLHMHKKFNTWLALGGHVEENENFVEAAHREVYEEAQIHVELIPFNKPTIVTSGVRELITPFTIFEEDIPAFGDVPAHNHIDSIYLGKLIGQANVVMQEKWGWFSKNELEKLDLLPEVRYVSHNALDIVKKHL